MQLLANVASNLTLAYTHRHTICTHKHTHIDVHAYVDIFLAAGKKWKSKENSHSCNTSERALPHTHTRGQAGTPLCVCVCTLCIAWFYDFINQNKKYWSDWFTRRNGISLTYSMQRGASLKNYWIAVGIRMHRETVIGLLSTVWLLYLLLRNVKVEFYFYTHVKEFVPPVWWL